MNTAFRSFVVCLVLVSGHQATAAQIDPSVTDVITRSSGDTTIRVVIRTGGQDHVISNAVVEWLVPDSAHNGERRIIKSTDVSMLASGMYSAWGPTFDVDDMGLACIVNVTNTHIGPYAP